MAPVSSSDHLRTLKRVSGYAAPMKELREALAGVYDIEAPLGRGGMALVYLARERRLDRRVALKVLDPDLAADAAYRERFLSEARTVARLTHPHIVPNITADDIGGFVFFAMAYVAGETLSRRIATQGPLDPQQAGRLLCDIGEALDYAHARGVVHRDVKPQNILLDAFTGGALLSDFGIAHQGPAARGLLGRPAAPGGPVVGTAAFMSPEQARGDVVDPRSDIYSLGVVAHYALAGRLPFNASTDEALLALHRTAPPPPVVTVAPQVPPRLALIVDRCLAKEPWARFPDAAALVRAVSACWWGSVWSPLLWACCRSRYSSCRCCPPVPVVPQRPRCSRASWRAPVQSNAPTPSANGVSGSGGGAWAACCFASLRRAVQAIRRSSRCWIVWKRPPERGGALV